MSLSTERRINTTIVAILILIVLIVLSGFYLLGWKTGVGVFFLIWANNICNTFNERLEKLHVRVQRPR